VQFEGQISGLKAIPTDYHTEPLFWDSMIYVETLKMAEELKQRFGVCRKPNRKEGFTGDRKI
jgi:hypothetical protein